MIGYVGKLEDQTLNNNYFRQVLFTAKNCQLVLMCLAPGEEIGMEVHPNVDQFFRIEQGQVKIIMNGEESTLTDGFGAIVPAGTQHNLINMSQTEEVRLYTIYSPPNHPEGTIHKTKEEALAIEKH